MYINNIKHQTKIYKIKVIQPLLSIIPKALLLQHIQGLTSLPSIRNYSFIRLENSLPSIIIYRFIYPISPYLQLSEVFSHEFDNLNGKNLDCQGFLTFLSTIENHEKSILNQKNNIFGKLHMIMSAIFDVMEKRM